MGIFSSMLNRKIGNKQQRKAAEMVANMVNNENEEGGGSQSARQNIHLLKIQWPLSSGSPTHVRFDDLDVNPETDFICPVIDKGQGHIDFLPWQIISLKVLYDAGEFTAQFTYNAIPYIVMLGCFMAPVPNSDPDNMEAENNDMAFAGISLEWSYYEPK